MEERARRLLISPLGLTPGVVTGAFFALEAAGYGPIDKVITFGTNKVIESDKGEEVTMAAGERMVRETLREARPGVVYETRRATTKPTLDQLADVNSLRQEAQKAIAAHVTDGYHVLLNVTGGRRSMTAALLLGAQYFAMEEELGNPGGDTAEDRAAALTVFHLEVLAPELEGRGNVAALLMMTPEERRPYLLPAAGAVQPVDISILLPSPKLDKWQSKLFEYAVGQYVQTTEGRPVRYGFYPAYLRQTDLGEVDVVADDGETLLLVECKLRVGPDPADKPVTATEVRRLLRKRAAVERATGRLAEARLFSNTPLAEAEALALAAAEGATIWCVTLPGNWRQRADWALADARPARAAWAEGESGNG